MNHRLNGFALFCSFLTNIHEPEIRTQQGAVIYRDEKEDKTRDWKLREAVLECKGTKFGVTGQCPGVEEGGVTKTELADQRKAW